MKKQDNTNRTTAIVCPSENQVQRKGSNQSLDEKYRDQITGLSVEAGRGVISALKENVADYKAIDAAKELSPVDKAIGKRKLLAWDIGLGTGTLGLSLGVAWLAKKVFAA